VLPRSETVENVDGQTEFHIKPLVDRHRGRSGVAPNSSSATHSAAAAALRMEARRGSRARPEGRGLPRAIVCRNRYRAAGYSPRGGRPGTLLAVGGAA
jgi:hypothetical protein